MVFTHRSTLVQFCLEFWIGVALYSSCKFKGLDDTNPAKEEPEYVDANQRDVAWLGFTWIKSYMHLIISSNCMDWGHWTYKRRQGLCGQHPSEDVAVQTDTY